MKLNEEMNKEKIITKIENKQSRMKELRDKLNKEMNETVRKKREKDEKNFMLFDQKYYQDFKTKNEKYYQNYSDKIKKIEKNKENERLKTLKKVSLRNTKFNLGFNSFLDLNSNKTKSRYNYYTKVMSTIEQMK